MEFLKNLIGFAALVLTISLSEVAPTVAEEWPNAENINRFAAEMSERHGFDHNELKALLAPLKPNSTILKIIAPPTDPETRSWLRYRARFLDPPRVENGVRFWNEHAATLARAEENFGVPPEIVVAIIGVETEYGRNKGNFSVLDALATIAFAYPPRGDFFRGELEQFLLLARENRQAPEAIRGSYAGAIGIPQFMPGSQRRFAVDFDEDGRVDLMNSAKDAIGSVARFLKIHGWIKGQPIAEMIKEPPSQPEKLLAAGIQPSLDRNALKGIGLTESKIPEPGPVALIDLGSPDSATEYWWGHQNFYAITRYNRSSFYAMSVTQLAEEIKKRRADIRPMKVAKKKQAREGSRAKPHRAE